MSDYQVMPPLTDEEYAALKADIAEHGVRVPVDVDEDGVLLDGHHRKRAADELGIPLPTRAVTGLDEDGKHEHATAVNVQRRQLSREQKRDLIRHELQRDPSRSDRAIAHLLGVSHHTVGAMRRGGWGIPQPEVTREQAEQLTANLRSYLALSDVYMVAALIQGASRVDLVKQLMPPAGWGDGIPRDAADAWWKVICAPRIDGVYAFPDSGHYRRVALDMLTWPVWPAYVPDIAAAAERELNGGAS